jgi:hypothetical protein
VYEKSDWDDTMLSNERPDISGSVRDQITNTVLIGENVASRTTGFLGDSLTFSGIGTNGFVTPKRVRYDAAPTKIILNPNDTRTEHSSLTEQNS